MTVHLICKCGDMHPFEVRMDRGMRRVVYLDDRVMCADCAVTMPPDALDDMFQTGSDPGIDICPQEIRDYAV